MSTCQDVAEQATEYLEKAMPPRERLWVWAHLRVGDLLQLFGVDTTR